MLKPLVNQGVHMTKPEIPPQSQIHFPKQRASETARHALAEDLTKTANTSIYRITRI